MHDLLALKPMPVRITSETANIQVSPKPETQTVSPTPTTRELRTSPTVPVAIRRVALAALQSDLARKQVRLGDLESVVYLLGMLP